MSRNKLIYIVIVTIFVIGWPAQYSRPGPQKMIGWPNNKAQVTFENLFPIHLADFPDDSQKSKIKNRLDDWLIQPQLLARSKLQMLWQKRLPLKEDEKLARLFILGDYIYALSDQNFLVSLNRKNGQVVFGSSIAPSGFPIIGLELYEGFSEQQKFTELFSLIGNRLVQIDPVTGLEQDSKRLKFGITCRPARNSSYFYVAGTDGRMRALRAEDKVELFEVTANNNSRITSIIADEKFVIFASDKGDCICITPDRPKQLWRFKAADAIVSPIIRDANSLFFASKDTNVYRIDLSRGKLIWKYQTPAILQTGPRVTNNVVYQYVHNKGLWAINKESGKFMWQLPEGLDLLAQANRKAYIIANGQLVVMDNENCKQLYSINFARVSKYATNVIDSKIYIADQAGRIACLKPIDQ